MKISKEYMRFLPLIADILTFVVLASVWYCSYPYFLKWMEGFSFFTTLPDYIQLHLLLPKDVCRYIGAFLLQFYKWPLAGATLQAVLSIIPVLCLWGVIKRIFDCSPYVCWISFLPLPVIALSQLTDLTLARTVTIAAFSILFLILTSVTARFVRQVHLPKFLGNPLLSCFIMIASVTCSMSVLTDKDRMAQEYEDIAYLEYLGDRGEWNRILESVSSADAVRNEYKRKYVLLALSETGQLPEYAFRYGLSSSEDFMFYNVEEPLCHNFNILFYRALGMYNPMIYQSFQQGVQSVSGATFYAVRHLVDACIQAGDHVLARKYLDILSHTTCHGKWVRERVEALSNQSSSDPYPFRTPLFVMESFLPDMSAMYDRYPDNNKFADYLLCGVLAEKDGGTFYNIFQIIAPNLYSEGRPIPRLYQEALLLIASKEPEILQMYRVDEEVWKRFADFTDLMRAGKGTQAKRKYADTYWAYIY